MNQPTDCVVANGADRRPSVSVIVISVVFKLPSVCGCARLSENQIAICVKGFLPII